LSLGAGGFMTATTSTWRRGLDPYQSVRHDHGTPKDLFGLFNAEFHFTIDACAEPHTALCERYYTYHENAFIQDFRGEVVWMNPPYGREIGKWMALAYNESQKGSTWVCLVPSRTDTKWWHEIVMEGEIRFIRGRLRFKDMINNAPFPSAIVIFRPPA